MDPEISFKLKKNRDNSSSEDKIHTIGDLMEVEEGEFNVRMFSGDRMNDNGVRASRPSQTPIGEMEESERVIREAEALKAWLYATPGNCSRNLSSWNNELANHSVHQSSLVDENYLVIGTHVDPNLQQKIINCEYVDFSKRISKGNMMVNEDHRMELVSKGGLTYFVPVSDCDSIVINSFSRWEQAFRVFSNIFTRAHPQKASELIEYNHVIHTASGTFTWDNVYTYDKEFRMHLSNYPQLSWAVILQQALSMYLKDRIFRDHNQSGGNQFRQKSNETCRRYNKGKCPNGASCKYVHKCEECGKFGHSAHICRT